MSSPIQELVPPYEPSTTDPECHLFAVALATENQTVVPRGVQNAIRWALHEIDRLRRELEGTP